MEKVKATKKSLKESEEADRQANFLKYRDSLSVVLNNAIALTKETA